MSASPTQRPGHWEGVNIGREWAGPCSAQVSSCSPDGLELSCCVLPRAMGHGYFLVSPNIFFLAKESLAVCKNCAEFNEILPHARFFSHLPQK